MVLGYWWKGAVFPLQRHSVLHNTQCLIPIFKPTVNMLNLLQQHNCLLRRPFQTAHSPPRYTNILVSAKKYQNTKKCVLGRGRWVLWVFATVAGVFLSRSNIRLGYTMKNVIKKTFWSTMEKARFHKKSDCWYLRTDETVLVLTCKSLDSATNTMSILAYGLTH